MAIAWDDTLKTGIADIDAQHQKLCHVVNALDDALDAGQDLNEVVKILLVTERCVERHFRFEEDYFERYNCPGKAQNKAEHAQFVRRFAELMKEFYRQGENLALCRKMYAELSTWLIRHIRGAEARSGGTSNLLAGEGAWSGNPNTRIAVGRINTRHDLG